MTGPSVARLWYSGVFAGLIPAVIAVAVFHASVGVMLGIWVAVCLLVFVGGLVPVIKGVSVFSCPHCKKQVKLGATSLVITRALA